MNPTQKIPFIVDPNAVSPGMEVTVPEDQRHAHSATVFESGAILMYLAERYDDLLPKTDFIMRYKVIEWTFWGSTGAWRVFVFIGTCSVDMIVVRAVWCVFCDVFLTLTSSSSSQ